MEGRRALKLSLFESNPYCYYCGQLTRLEYEAARTQATLDHLIPVSQGGTDDRKNLVLACYYCNLLKGNTSADEYIAYRTSLTLRQRLDMRSYQIWKTLLT